MVAISKEEEVQKISTSIFVTNSPDHAKAKDLWNICKQYSQVVDAFIPDRKSKAGKRYGFVRFIRVYDVDRLVSNLCTLWMGSHHLHANVARMVKMSYVNVVNGDTKSTEACEPALLLDESCLNQLDYSLDIEGIPLKLWSESTFNRIVTKWGKILYLEKLDEGCFYSKRMCILTNGKSNILETFKIIHKGKRFSVRAKETTGWIPDFVEQEEDNSESEDEQSVDSVTEDENVQDEEKGTDLDVNNSLDPFELYPLLNKKRNVEEKMDKSNGTVSISFPPGFTPCDEREVVCDKKSTGLNPKAKKDWVKEICVSHKVNFLTLQETKMDNISLIDVKCCWGNYAFEYVYSPAVGTLGGILFVWEKSTFKKNNSTISDYFVMLGGSWLCSGVNLLIISVYAPQEYAGKKLLWDYLVHVISKWDGEVIVMGDF
nr:RNA-directed DNA polymerase, eukaryota [Tanacetum cinerariifolium]